MTDIHDRGRALAIRQLAPRPVGKGAPLVLRVVTPGVRNPATGTTPPATENDYPGSGLRTQYARKDVDGTQILATDVRLLVSPVLLDGSDMPTPKPGQRVQFDGGQWYTVQNCSAWDYAGVSIGFVVQGRAA